MRGSIRDPHLAAYTRTETPHPSRRCAASHLLPQGEKEKGHQQSWLLIAACSHLPRLRHHELLAHHVVASVEIFGDQRLELAAKTPQPLRLVLVLGNELDQRPDCRFHGAAEM